MQQKNVLILDEPTNHLDIPSREELERVLANYAGTLIFVSHDRYFREKVSQRNLKIVKGQLIDLSAQVEESLPADKLLLEFQRDQLLAELSLINQGHPDYQKKNQQFNQINQALKNLTE